MAQMNDALHHMRQILKIKSRMIQFKNRNIRGQREGTRSRAVIDRVHEKARAAAAKYRAARDAHLALAGPGEWEKTYRVLHDADIRGYQDPELIRERVSRRGTFEDGQEPVSQELGISVQGEGARGDLTLFNEPRERRDGTGETRRKISWIWTVRGNGEDSGASADNADDEILRVEWSKSRARQLRATEEVMMLKEEMRRCLAYLTWKQNWWIERRNARTGLSKDMCEAIASYATTQAGIQESLKNQFQKLWEKPLDAVEDDEQGEDDEDEGDENDDENGTDNDETEYEDDEV